MEYNIKTINCLISLVILNLTSPAPNNGSFGALHHILRNPSTVDRVQGNKNDGNTTKVKASEFVKAVDNADCHKLCSFLPGKVMYNSSERCTNHFSLMFYFKNILPFNISNQALAPPSPTLLKSILSLQV